MAIAEHYLANGLRDEAKRYCVLAAKQGSSVAAGAAGTLYEEDGENAQALEWFRLACRAGNKLACTHLSIAYLGGHMGLKPDRRKAAEYGRLGDPRLWNDVLQAPHDGLRPTTRSDAAGMGPV